MNKKNTMFYVPTCFYYVLYIPSGILFEWNTPGLPIPDRPSHRCLPSFFTAFTRTRMDSRSPEEPIKLGSRGPFQLPEAPRILAQQKGH